MRGGCDSGGLSVLVRSVFPAACAAAVVLCLAGHARGAVVFGQSDDFEDGTVMEWMEGFLSPNPPSNVADGGPGGAGDAFVRNESSGGPREGSRQVMFNQAQWAGNYAAAHVTRIDAWLANFGTTPLHMRVAVQSSAGSAFASTNAALVPADGVWRPVTFELTSGSMTRVLGTQDLASALSDVRELRLLSAQAGPAIVGDGVASVLAADDLRASHLPGDANFDGEVDGADLLTWRRHRGARGDSADWEIGDFNFDDRVDARDLVLLRRNFGRSPTLAAVGAAPVAVVPEPTALAGITIVAGLALRRRSRR